MPSLPKGFADIERLTGSPVLVAFSLCAATRTAVVDSGLFGSMVGSDGLMGSENPFPVIVLVWLFGCLASVVLGRDGFHTLEPHTALGET